MKQTKWQYTISLLGYMGCFKDDRNRHLKYRIADLSHTTLLKCKQHCRGFKYTGLQAGAYCLCGNTLINPTYPRVLDSECNFPCPGESFRMCGAGWKNSIYRDVVYVIDKSGSVTESNFNEAINFIYMVTEYLTIGNDAIMVSIVTYSTTYSLEFALNTYSTNTSVLTAINGLIGTTTDGNTYTGEALRFVQTYILQTSNGARTGVDKVVVVLTDGASNGAIDPGTAADSLRTDGVEVFAVGIGTSHLNELQDIANDPASYYVMYVSDFIFLCGLIPALVPKLGNYLD
ncbi:COL14A [Mytilus coruscus]|uniref:COL14A n=1 Tax=Mytilus coruscus TaxID=42192 RepID=A0A6J8DPD4_MYTCO|nr:COL14A [Mytilus coruscus]